ncbi:2-keto-4-pentenoate hydratase [Bradyrhizobium sp. 2TAF24]|uniref:2-keto-4-pentenoate hydratase n=1 Tax=Bradyrhizobium sp. 2TAF24 TaxID=3233011 RepID=UPI003F91EF99
MNRLDVIENVAVQLATAEREGKPIAPIGDIVGRGDVSAAYAVQAAVTRSGLAIGRRRVGRKIGLTSRAVQAQLGVEQPDYGVLFADMAIDDGDRIAANTLIQPRIEAEIALVLSRDLPAADTTSAELLRAVDHAVAALEIVDSRIVDWQISIVDTIADNGSSARFVLGLEPRRLTDLNLETCGMALSRNGDVVSVGAGVACLGHPLRSALWLARTMAAAGEPLRAGEVILTGALGPMVSVAAGDYFEARIGGFAPVRVSFQ